MTEAVPSVFLCSWLLLGWGASNSVTRIQAVVPLRQPTRFCESHGSPLLTYASFGPTDPTGTYSYLHLLLKFVGTSFRKMETFTPRDEWQQDPLPTSMRLLQFIYMKSCVKLRVDEKLVLYMNQRWGHM